MLNLSIQIWRNFIFFAYILTILFLHVILYWTDKELGVDNVKNTEERNDTGHKEMVFRSFKTDSSSLCEFCIAWRLKWQLANEFVFFGTNAD